MKKQIVKWLFKEQLQEIEKLTDELTKNRNLFANGISEISSVGRVVKHQANEIQQVKRSLENTVGNIGVGADIHMRSENWAVINIQGEKDNFLKFVRLGREDLRAVQQFLSRFDRKNVTDDCPPHMRDFLRFQ